jgi:hypothetical protein
MELEPDLKLLVLARPARSQDRVGSELDRVKALTDIKSSGAKIRHDSGGRLVVIDVSGVDEEVLSERLAGVRVVPLADDLTESIPDLDTNESLFLEALRIRTSPDYRELKSRQVPGESPEEQEMFSAPCMPEG